MLINILSNINCIGYLNKNNNNRIVFKKNYDVVTKFIYLTYSWYL